MQAQVIPVSKAKAQGTRYETLLVNWLLAHGYTAERLAEAGIADIGDIRAQLHDSEWILEAKHRQQLSVQATLAKAKQKAKGKPVLLFWKRLVRTSTSTRRAPVAGVPEVVIMTPEDLLKLLALAAGTEPTVP